MQKVKKIIAIIMCYNLCFAPMALAQTTAQPKCASQQEIAKLISFLDNPRILGPIAAVGWATAICAVSAMVRKAAKRALMTPEQELEQMYKKLDAGVASHSIYPYEVDRAGRMMRNKAAEIAANKNAYFYKFYQILPTYDAEISPFWEKSYTRNGGVIPQELDNLRGTINELQLSVSKVNTSKQTKKMSTLIMSINEKFYTLESLPAGTSEEANKLISLINTDKKALALLTQKVGNPELKSSLERFTAAITSEMELRNFRATLSDLQATMNRVYSSAATKESMQMNVLISKVSNNLIKASRSGNEKEVQKLITSIDGDTKAISAIAQQTGKQSVKEASETFLRQVSKELKGKGGIIGAGAVLLAGAALMVMSSQEAQAAVVSDKRIMAQRDLAFAYKNTPELFLAAVAKAKQQYGLNIVSSVIYENQSSYYPVLKQQMDIMKNPIARKYIKLALSSGNTPQDNKAELIKAFAK